jgi:hypothetical protein
MALDRVWSVCMCLKQLQTFHPSKLSSQFFKQVPGADFRFDPRPSATYLGGSRGKRSISIPLFLKLTVSIAALCELSNLGLQWFGK